MNLALDLTPHVLVHACLILMTCKPLYMFVFCGDVTAWSTYLNEGAEYTPVNIWVGQLRLTATDDPPQYVSVRAPFITELMSTNIGDVRILIYRRLYFFFLRLPQVDEMPHLNVTSPTGDSPIDVQRGKSEVFTITLKLPPQSRSNIRVHVATGFGLHMCHIRVTEVGSSFPCLDVEALEAEYTTDEESYFTSVAEIDFGIVTNVGMCALLSGK